MNSNITTPVFHFRRNYSMQRYTVHIRWMGKSTWKKLCCFFSLYVFKPLRNTFLHSFKYVHIFTWEYQAISVILQGWYNQTLHFHILLFIQAPPIQTNPWAKYWEFKQSKEFPQLPHLGNHWAKQWHNNLSSFCTDRFMFTSCALRTGVVTDSLCLTTDVIDRFLNLFMTIIEPL